jgi:sugar-phosphatase
VTSPADLFSIEVQAMLFDLDGTLVDSDAVVERVWRRWSARVGVPVESFLHKVYGRPGKEVMAELLPGRPVERNAADNAEMLAWEVEEVEGVIALPGAAELLAALPEHRWAIVTACTTPLALARLAAAGLPVPRVLVTAEQLAAGKPSPEGYLKAAAALGAPPDRCVVVEDAPAGVAAAGAAGMPVIVIGERPIDPEPAVRISTPGQIRPGLRGDLLSITVDGARRR